jgi:hypothetical protein
MAQVSVINGYSLSLSLSSSKEKQSLIFASLNPTWLTASPFPRRASSSRIGVGEKCLKCAESQVRGQKKAPTAYFTWRQEISRLLACVLVPLDDPFFFPNSSKRHVDGQLCCRCAHRCWRHDRLCQEGLQGLSVGRGCFFQIRGHSGE